MLEQIENYENNVLAIEVIGSFTEADEKICQKFFEKKIDQGFKFINVLVKLDEMKVDQTSIKAFMEDFIWVLRNYKHMGHFAVVAHSKVLKALVPIDNLFFKRAKEGRQERYFDISQIDEAMKFINPEK